MNFKKQVRRVLGENYLNLLHLLIWQDQGLSDNDFMNHQPFGLERANPCCQGHFQEAGCWHDHSLVHTMVTEKSWGVRAQQGLEYHLLQRRLQSLAEQRVGLTRHQEAGARD